MGQRMGCTCFDLLADIGTAAGTNITVFTAANETFNVTIREAVTPTSEVLKATRANRNINFCCDQIIAIESRPGG